MEKSENENIAIIGAGPLGRAIEKILREKEIHPLIWDIDESKITKKISLRETVCSAEIIFLAVPSWALKNAAQDIISHAPKESILISMAKGMEVSSRLTMDALLSSCVGIAQCAIISGPMLAGEIMKDEFSFGVLASESEEVFIRVSRLFSETSLHLSYSPDVPGVALAGILKNIYAIAFGMIAGLDMGHNIKGGFMTMAVSEMSKIIKFLGGKEETAYSYAGIGDLVATGLSPLSRNHRFGFEIATKRSSDIKCEGLASLPPFYDLIKGKIDESPFFKVIYEIVVMQKDPKQEITRLLKVGHADKI